MSATPWAPYVTPSQELVRCLTDLGKGYLYVTTGNRPGSVRACRIQAQTLQLEFRPDPDSEWGSLEPYMLPLQPWKRSSMPFVRLNPLALPHLIATEQIPRWVLFRSISGQASVAGGWHIALSASCPLLTELRCKEAFVMFGTHYDFSVGGL